MNFSGFGLNYDPPLMPAVQLSPQVPFYTLSDGSLVTASLAADLTSDHGLCSPDVASAESQRPPEPSAAPPRSSGAGLKIRRPPNAFMVFANEHRKILARAFPKENNQSISVRLGSMWKAMPADHKNIYYQVAKEAAAEHKRLYPSYVYSPKEARMRKQARELVRREKAVKPGADGTAPEIAGAGGGCEGDAAPSTETRAKLMEVAQLLDSISSDRLLHQSRRRPSQSGGSAADPGSPCSVSSSHLIDQASPGDGKPEERLSSGQGRAPPPPHQDGHTRGHSHLPVSGRDFHWPPPQAPGAGGPFVPLGRAPDGQMVYQSLVAGATAYAQAGAACCPRAEMADGGGMMRDAAARATEQHWAAASHHHHLHGGGYMRPAQEAPYPTQLVPLTAVSWPGRFRSPAAAPVASVPLARPRLSCAAAAAAAAPVRPQEFCLHFLAGGSCNHCRPAASACCGAAPTACQCQCLGVLGFPQQQHRFAHQPPLPHQDAPHLGQPAMVPISAAQCGVAGSPLGPGMHAHGHAPPMDRHRRAAAPVQLRIPDPRVTQRLRDAPSVDLRSCWRAVAMNSAGGSHGGGAGSDGSVQAPGGAATPQQLWDSPPLAAFLRATHSPNIEELVGSDQDPLSL